MLEDSPELKKEFELKKATNQTFTDTPMPFITGSIAKRIATTAAIYCIQQKENYNYPV